jgi:hypothetical protein
MKLRVALAAMSLMAFAAPAVAAEDAYVRLTMCRGPDATMEIYVPQSVVDHLGISGWPAMVEGLYALDLSDAGKGKHLEPVHIAFTDSGRVLTIEQYTRGLKPTTIPASGATVDFDNRFGTHAKCAPFGI